MQTTIQTILGEIRRVILGKDDVIVKMLTAMLADGHILLDDVPGVGKTTLAVAISRAMGLEYRRIQFTPDVLPSDITGFSLYNKKTGGFSYMPGVVTAANLLLGDEINRTSSKTQSALLEAMEEGQVTVDGETHPLKTPFIVIATQNQVGSAGTQLLPHAQLDRFLVKLTIGYPDLQHQMEIIRDRQQGNPVDRVRPIVTVNDVIRMQHEVQAVEVKDAVIEYIARLTEETRRHAMVELGVSPRGAICVNRMAKSLAYIDGRDYVTPDDVRAVFTDTCAHRILLNQKARIEHVQAEAVLHQILQTVPVPGGLKK